MLIFAKKDLPESQVQFFDPKFSGLVYRQKLVVRVAIILNHQDFRFWDHVKTSIMVARNLIT